MLAVQSLMMVRCGEALSVRELRPAVGRHGEGDRGAMIGFRSKKAR